MIRGRHAGRIELSWFCWEGLKGPHSRIFENPFLCGAQFPIDALASPGLILKKGLLIPGSKRPSFLPVYTAFQK